MYRYELHMHTKEGSACAVSLVEDMIKQYVKIGFSGIPNQLMDNRFFRCCCNKPFYKRQHLCFTFSAVGTAYYAIQQGIHERQKNRRRT